MTEVAGEVVAGPVGPVGPSPRAPTAPPPGLDTALVDTMVQGARVAAAAEGMALAAIAGLVAGRQAAARQDLLAWRREHPAHRIARQAWDVAAADCDESVAGEVADEVGAALRLSRRAARARVDLALDLATVAPATFAALRSGTLDVPRARRIVEALTPLHAQDPAVAARIEAELLTRAPDRTAAQVAASARRAVLRHARGIAEEATEQAHTERQVGVEHAWDPAGRDAGRASLRLTGRADRVQAAFENVTRAARAHLDSHPDEARTLDQVRADLALRALLGDLRTGRPRPGDPSDPTRAPDPPLAVHLVLPLATLAGGDEPGELLGHGPVPAPLARDLLLRGDVTFTRWLTDRRGVVVATPATAYRPPAALARTVRARDLACRFPGCRTGADRCDLDHAVPWPTGGTSPANLATVCRGHHQGKTANRWAVTLHPATAALTWTAPTGHTYTTHPPAWPEGP